MAFVGIQFEDSSICLVNSAWLTPLKKEVFWPPYKKQEQYDRALKKGEKPSQENWKLHQVAKIYFTCDDLKKSLKKIKLLEVNSDIQTTDEENFEALSAKRHRRPSRKLCEIYSSAESQTDSNDENYATPKSKKSKFLNSIDLPNITLTPGSQKIVDDLTLEHFQVDTSIVNRSVAGPCNTPTLSDISNNTTNSAYSELLKNPDRLVSLLVHVKEQNNQILALLKEKPNLNLGQVQQLPESFPIQLPVDEETDLQVLETYLTEKDNFNSLQVYLTRIGGSSLNSKINKILKSCITNKLASTYSFCGTRNSKKGFQDLILQKVIIGAAESIFPDVDRSKLEDPIKTWLKHAPQRLKIENSKKSI